MYYEENGNNILISKSKPDFLPKCEEVYKILELEEKVDKLNAAVKGSYSRYKENENRYSSIKTNMLTMALLPTISTIGFDIGMGVMHFTNTPIKHNPIGAVIVTNLALGSIIYMCVKKKIELDKQKLAVKVQFDEIFDVINSEVTRLSIEQQKLAGNDTALTLSYIKIKSL